MSARCTWWPHEGGPPSPHSGLEIDDFADRGQFSIEGLQTELQTGPAGFAVQQPGQGRRHHAVESMNADLLIGPVIQGLPADEVVILHGAEGGLHMTLTAVSQNDLLRGPLVVIGELDPSSQGGCRKPVSGESLFRR